MPEAISIRPATPDDKEVVLDLWLALLHDQQEREPRFGVAEDAAERWRNDFPEWLSDDARCLLVAEQGKELVGFVSAERWTPPPIYAGGVEVYVNELYVRPELRRGGVGRRLVGAVKAWAGDLDAERVRLGVLTANEAGRAFWQSLDAKPLSETLTIALENTPEHSDSTDENPIGF